MKLLPFDDLFATGGECTVLGHADPDENEAVDRLALVHCAVTLILPLTFFRIWRQRMTLTFSTPSFPVHQSLTLLTGTTGGRGGLEKMSVQADVDCTKFARVRVVDCVMFNNELDMLELRLLNHDSFADWIVIIESATTHSGRPKPLVFKQNQARFRRFAHKLVYRVVELPFEEPQMNEGHARSECLRVVPLLNLTKDDLMLIGDLDKIVDSSRFVHAVITPLFVALTGQKQATICSRCA